MRRSTYVERQCTFHNHTAYDDGTICTYYIMGRICIGTRAYFQSLHGHTTYLHVNNMQMIIVMQFGSGCNNYICVYIIGNHILMNELHYEDLASTNNTWTHLMGLLSPLHSPHAATVAAAVECRPCRRASRRRPSHHHF